MTETEERQAPTLEEMQAASAPLDEYSATARKRPATPNMKYPGAIVDRVEPSALFDNELEPENGEPWDFAATVYFKHDDIPDGEQSLIRKRVKWRKNAPHHEKSGMYALIEACWPNVEDRIGKQPPFDFVGCVVDIRTSAKTSQSGNPYTEIAVMSA